MRFKPESVASEDMTKENVRPNMTLEDSIMHLKKHTTSAWHKMVNTNFSLGIERNVKQLQKNNLDHTKWSNPLEVQLPMAPSMKIYCCVW